MKTTENQHVEAGLKSVLSNLACVDSVADSFLGHYFDDLLSIQVKCLDFEGQEHEICISSQAIRQLSDKLHEAQVEILSRSVNPSKGISFGLVSGPTQGETYYPGGNHEV